MFKVLAASSKCEVSEARFPLPELTARVDG